MDIIVCVKRVPFTQEVDLEVDPQKISIKKENLTCVINEWDNYATEEAIRIKEKMGGTVTTITIGDEEDEEILRRCLAMGADRAIRIDPEDSTLDAYTVSKILSKVITDLEYDLVLTGVQSDDLNNGITGGMLSEQLGIVHSSVVNGIECRGNDAMITVELEGGIEEVLTIDFPALLTIQTGINEPRYVSIMGIRKAAKKELIVMNLNDLKLSKEDLEPGTMIEELFLPPETEGAEIIEGDPSFIAEEVIRIVKEMGVSI